MVFGFVFGVEYKVQMFNLLSKFIKIPILKFIRNSTLLLNLVMYFSSLFISFILLVWWQVGLLALLYFLVLVHFLAINANVLPKRWLMFVVFLC